jgi:hypothetical protein
LTVAVLASPEDGPSLSGILGALAEAGVDAYGLKIHSSWESLELNGILSRIEKASHFLVLATRANLASSWFKFAVGYGRGRGVNFALFRLDPSRDFPSYLSGLPVLDGLGELAAYYRIAREDGAVQEERRAARASLLEKGISVNDDSLAQCARDGDAKAVELFMKAGFHPDSRDRHGVPLLCLAARGKHRDIAELLLGRGAQIDLQSEDRGYSPLMDATQSGSADLAGLFLEKGANPNLSGKDGQTALILAVGRNDSEVALLLVSNGADPDHSDKLGCSARKYAALFKNPAILSLFGPASSAM